jgi:flagellar basal-body rod protein FlgF
MRSGNLGPELASLGSRQQQLRLDVISNNIANAGTPGFKKDDVRFENFMTEVTSADLGQGNIQSTGRPLDISLSGDGFLKVQSGNNVLYTRAGNLKLDKQGTLVTQDNLPVLGQKGPIVLSKGKPRIDANGQVFDDNQNVGSLNLVQFPPNTQLTKGQNGYFSPVDPRVAPLPATNCTIRDGTLEEANFSVVEEMTQMIDTMRTYEAYQKVIHSFDQIDSQLMNKYAGT